MHCSSYRSCAASVGVATNLTAYWTVGGGGCLVVGGMGKGGPVHSARSGIGNGMFSNAALRRRVHTEVTNTALSRDPRVLLVVNTGDVVFIFG